MNLILIMILIISELIIKVLNYAKYYTYNLKIISDSLIIVRHFFLTLKPNLPESLRKKCPYSELFWSVFSRIRTKYGPE